MPLARRSRGEPALRGLAWFTPAVHQWAAAAADAALHKGAM